MHPNLLAFGTHAAEKLANKVKSWWNDTGAAQEGPSGGAAPPIGSAPKGVQGVLRKAMSYVHGFAGMCLRYARTVLGIPGGAPSAIRAWYGATGKHTDRNPPPGVPVFFGPHGSPYGHVGISMGGGVMRSAHGSGSIRNDPISWWTRIGYPYKGWATGFNGHRVPGYANGGVLPRALEFDSGGWLPPGASVVVNNTGQPEPLARLDVDRARRGEGLAGGMPSVLEVRDVDGVLIGRMQVEAGRVATGQTTPLHAGRAAW
jgi:hypothetical protein